MDTMNRRTYLGGSDTAAILGLSPWKSPLELYLEKIGEAPEQAPDPAREKVLNRGKRWEPVVIDMLLDELRSRGHEVKVIARNRRHQDADLPYLAAEIDLELRVDGEEVNGEMKTVHPFAAKAWGEPGSDEIPVYYTAQVMHGLMVKPRPRCIVAALIGADDLRIHEVRRDADIIASIRASEVEFWRRVQERDPPPVRTAADALALFPQDAGTVVEASADVLSAFNRLRELKAQAKDIDADITALEDAVKAYMLDAATLASGGQVLATWRAQTARRFDQKAFRAAHPDLAEQFTVASVSRVFRIK